MTYKIYFKWQNGYTDETKVRGEKKLEKTLKEMVDSGNFKYICYEKKGEYGTVEYIEVLDEQ